MDNVDVSDVKVEDLAPGAVVYGTTMESLMTLRCVKCQSGDDEESDDELGVSKSLSASQMTKSLSESLMAVYKPSQTHKRAKKNVSDDSFDKASEENDKRVKLLKDHSEEIGE